MLQEFNCFLRHRVLFSFVETRFANLCRKPRLETVLLRVHIRIHIAESNTRHIVSTSGKQPSPRPPSESSLGGRKVFRVA